MVLATIQSSKNVVLGRELCATGTEALTSSVTLYIKALKHFWFFSQIRAISGAIILSEETAEYSMAGQSARH